MAGASLGILGGAGLAAAATVKTAQKSAGYDTAAQMYRTAMGERGKEGSTAEIESIVRTAANYNLDITSTLQSIASEMLARPNMDRRTITRSTVGAGVYGKGIGASSEQVGRAQYGLSQFMTSQNAENLNQITENLKGSATLMANALGVSLNELKQAKTAGTLAQLTTNAGGSEAVFKRFSDQMVEVGARRFEETRNSLPERMDKLSSTVDRLSLVFGAEARGGMLDFFETLIKILSDNEQTIVAAGEWMGVSLGNLSTAINETMTTLQPHIDQWIQSWNALSDSGKASQVTEFFDAIADGITKLLALYAVALAVESPKKAAILLSGLGIAAADYKGGLVDKLSETNSLSGAGLGLGGWLGGKSRAVVDSVFSTPTETDKPSGVREAIAAQKLRQSPLGGVLSQSFSPSFNVNTHITVDTDNNVLREEYFVSQTPD
jgi:tape measure domain-containing protein